MARLSSIAEWARHSIFLMTSWWLQLVLTVKVRVLLRFPTTVDLETLSFWCSWGEAIRPFPQGYSRRQGYTDARFGMWASGPKELSSFVSHVLLGFEQANQPTITDDERRKLLHFCIVGGGPTGVEFAAELHDLFHTDMKRHYPGLASLARISLFDVASKILGGFDEQLQEWENIYSIATLLDADLPRYATKKFNREGIRLLTKRHVERVEEVGTVPDVSEEWVWFGLRASYSLRKKEKVPKSPSLQVL